MRLYHGSTAIVDKPEIRSRNAYLDFGAGFYTTTSYEQAERWARIKMRRENSNVGYVCLYEFDYDAAKENGIIRRFDSADKDWLLFVVDNRRGETFDSEVDMHIGPVADDNVYQSIRFFETGIYDADETVKRLKTELLHDQWTFHTSKMLSFCKFIECKEVK